MYTLSLPTVLDHSKSSPLSTLTIRQLFFIKFSQQSSEPLPVYYWFSCASWFIIWATMYLAPFLGLLANNLAA